MHPDVMDMDDYIWVWDVHVDTELYPNSLEVSGQEATTITAAINLRRGWTRVIARYYKETKKTKTTSSVVPSRPKSSHVQTSIYPSARPTKICLTGAADNLRTEDSCAPNPICPE
jgi:hypothetical protein